MVQIGLSRCAVSIFNSYWTNELLTMYFSHSISYMLWLSYWFPQGYEIELWYSWWGETEPWISQQNLYFSSKKSLFHCWEAWIALLHSTTTLGAIKTHTSLICDPQLFIIFYTTPSSIPISYTGLSFGPVFFTIFYNHIWYENDQSHGPPIWSRFCNSILQPNLVR